MGVVGPGLGGVAKENTVPGPFLDKKPVGSNLGVGWAGGGREVKQGRPRAPVVVGEAGEALVGAGGEGEGVGPEVVHAGHELREAVGQGVGALHRHLARTREPRGGRRVEPGDRGQPKVRGAALVAL